MQSPSSINSTPQNYNSVSHLTLEIEAIKEKVKSYIEITLLSSKNKNKSPNIHKQKKMSKIQTRQTGKK